MGTITYGVRPTYTPFAGGVIFVDDRRDLDVGAALTTGGGQIVVNDADTGLVRALDAYPPLQRTAYSPTAPLPGATISERPLIKRPDPPSVGNVPVLQADGTYIAVPVSQLGGAGASSISWDLGTYMGTAAGGIYDGGAINLLHTTPAAGGSAALFYPLHVQETFLGADAALPTSNTYRGISSTVNYGDATHAAKGTIHGQTTRVIVNNSADASNEHGLYVGYLRYSDALTATPGRAWFTDWGLHSAIGVQQSLLAGVTMVVNNHYNGQPSSGPAGATWLVTGSGMGFGADGPHNAASTYPVGVGLGIVGKSTAGTLDGFTAGIMVGTARMASLISAGSASGWGVTASQFALGALITDWRDAGVWIGSRAASGTGPGIHFRAAAAANVMIEGRVEGEAVVRYYAAASGYQEWGDGTNPRDVVLQRGGANVLQLGVDDALELGSGVGSGGGFFSFWKQGADPGAPAGNKARLFLRDPGTGKMQLAVRFPTGAVQPLATEP